MTDLQAKYQILATEYSKLRAQVPVLKKAVLDEKAIEEQLKDSLKEKDQSIRKFEQEVDSLTFRNQQLSTRVGVLQKELEETIARGTKKNKAKHGSSDGAATASVNIIVDEELRSKIEENARLHKKVYDLEHDHQDDVERLQTQLSSLQAEASRHEEVLNNVVTSNKEKVNKLQEDKAVLEVKLQRQEKDTREAIKRATELEEQVSRLENEMGVELHRVTTTLQRKVPFDDTADRSLNSLNVPSHDHHHHLVAKELISQAGVLIGDLLTAFADWYNHSEERARLTRDSGDGEKLCDISRRYCEHLLGHASVLTSVRRSFQVFTESIHADTLILLETVTHLQDFAIEWKRFTAFTQNLLPYQLLTLDEESALSSCPSTLIAKNKELQTSLQRLSNVLALLDNYVSLLAAQSMPNCGHPKSSQAKMFVHMVKVVTNFHESLRDLSRHFNAKLSLEHQLPTATQKVKVIDECILSAIISLVTSSSKISAFFSGNLTFFTTSMNREDDHVVSVSTNPAVTSLRQKAVDYMKFINRPPVDSVPYVVALENRKTVYSFTESKETLTQQVLSLQEKLGRLEQEREHWLLETQLLQMKYQKEAQQQQNNGVALSNQQRTTDRAQSSVLNGSLSVTTSMLGQIEIVGSSSDIDKGELLREQVITNHYQSRMAEATAQLQLADSKALHFYAECRALQKRLSIREKEKDKIQEELVASNQSNAQLKDELQTTTRSYEGQLSMMSEHLAGMNERLTTQKDEIDLLRYQLQQAHLQHTSGKGVLSKKTKPAR